MSARLVVVLCGPPGAGKSTAARESGLDVFDRDDPVWDSEKHFRSRIADLDRDDEARAVVIRTGATASARARASALVGATHVYLLAPSRAECERRIRCRRRGDMVRSLAAAREWFATYDGGVPSFPGWSTVFASPAGDLHVSEEW